MTGRIPGAPGIQDEPDSYFLSAAYIMIQNEKIIKKN
jgi:hypothetical protein